MVFWGLGIGYLAVLFLAAIWAVIERIRSAMAERQRTLLDPTNLITGEPNHPPTLEPPDLALPLAGPATTLPVEAA
jgi:hypothetical protein